ncbi:MAG TPA: PEGA domain-containing protein [Polyangia bacterium]|nr:PEGA domain-containing protein [Polyangia bacterium]
MKRLAGLALASFALASSAAWITPAPVDAPAAKPAAAPAAAPPSAAKLGEARLHFQQGVALYKEQNFDAALAEFQGAYAISGEPVVLYNLGLTQKALFRYADAAATLERYLSESAAHGQPVAKARRAEVENLVAEMHSLLADVTLVVKPAEASVLVDGRAAALGIDGVVKLAAGSHVVEATAPGYVGDKKAITVVAGVPQTLALTLAAIPKTGHVRVQSSEIGARVAIDGKDLGPAPVELELAPGGHTVEATAPGFAPTHLEIVVAAGQARTIVAPLERPRAAEAHLPGVLGKWWFWTGVVAVAAATTATIALWPAGTQGPITGSLGTTDTTYKSAVTK